MEFRVTKKLVAWSLIIYGIYNINYLKHEGCYSVLFPGRPHVVKRYKSAQSLFFHLRRLRFRYLTVH